MSVASTGLLEHHLTSPSGRGALADAPHAGAAGGAACGDLIRIAVRIEGDTVAEAGFDASGCVAALAAGSAVVELAAGRPVLEVATITPADVEQELGGLSPAARHAAVLAADALHRALGAAAADGAITLAPNPNRRLVAMSGGVDSAVAAGLAVEAGHEVIGVTLELWADAETDGAKSCCSPQALVGARALAHSMGLPHLTLDRRESFRSEVVADFLSEHVAGNTPNPCVRCNGRVRFGAMLELAERLGAPSLATGHYARLTDQHGDGAPLLTRARDGDKDQTYMLAAVSGEQLERLWFPLGDLTKPEVREIARRQGLGVAEKPESQDLCFLAGTARARFFERHGEGELQSGEGDVLDTGGRKIGTHPGHERFTVGQRRGIGVAASEPLFVLAKDARTNTLTVGPRAALATNAVSLVDVALRRPASSIAAVKLRYRQDPIGCHAVEPLPAGSHERLSLRLAKPADGVAPGQIACLMDGDTVLGWARIEAGIAGV